MTDFAKLILGVDTRGLKEGRRELDRTGDEAKRTAQEVDASAGKMGAAFKRVGIALAAVGAADALLQFGKASAQAAIDAQEMDSAFGVVFGSMADDVRKWAEETGNALGRSTQEIQRGALAFQELFGKALDPAKAAELSKQFAVLTQDLASFKNLSNEVAQQKLFAGLVGEAEPLRAVGVFLSENALQARAAAMGLGDFSKELTDQEKIVVRAAEIQAQLAQASGDVARTSDSTANQIKTMNAAVEELQVAVGQKLLPQLTPLISVTAELVTMMANAAQQINVTATQTQNFIEGLRVLGGWVQRVASGIAGFANSIGLTGERLQWLTNKASFLINPVSRLVGLFERIGGLQRSQQRVGDLLGGSFSTDFIAGELAAFKGTVSAINAPSALPMVASNIGAVGKAARASGGAIRAANDDLRETIDLAAQYRNLTMSDASGGIMGNNSLFGFNATLGAADFGLIGGFAEQFQEFDATLGKTANNTQTQTQVIADSFAQMADRALQALDRMVGAIRGGGFLDILSSVVNFGIQLGGMGVFGKKVQANILAGARANGGQVNAGRTYLVGERGPELFSPATNGQIVANDNMRGGGMIINVDARGSSDPEAVRQQVERGILEAAPAIVAAAQQRTITTLRRPKLAGAL